MTIEVYLKQLGLDDKEIKIYLACLEIGESAIMPIVDKVGLPRTTVFHILERLGQRKLVEIVQKGSRHLYIPYPPRHLVTLMKQDREKMDEQIESLKTALPELSRVYSHSSFEPKVRFFKGNEIRQIYDEILEIGADESWYVGESDKIVQALGEKYLRNWIEKRVKLGVRSKSVRVRSNKSEEEIFEGGKKYLRNIRYAPVDFKSPTHILIYGDNVAYITTGEENFGLVITSRESAQTMRNWFNQLWKISVE